MTSTESRYHRQVCSALIQMIRELDWPSYLSREQISFRLTMLIKMHPLWAMDLDWAAVVEEVESHYESLGNKWSPPTTPQNPGAAGLPDDCQKLFAYGDPMPLLGYLFHFPGKGYKFRPKESKTPASGEFSASAVEAVPYQTWIQVVHSEPARAIQKPNGEFIVY